MKDLERLIHEPSRLYVERQPQVDKELYHPDLHDAIDHAHGTEDPVFAAAPHPRFLNADPELALRTAGLWLEEGYRFGLHIEHSPLESAGPFLGGGNKWLWHITVSPWSTVDSMLNVLRNKRAAPHFVIGGRSGLKHPVVIQTIPLNQAARALAHPSGPETNRADCIQVEICATVEDVGNFSDKTYKALANLVRLTNNTVSDSRKVRRKLARAFANTDRFIGTEFVRAQGHCGHMHVPGNDHTDPTTKFKGSHLIGLLELMPSTGYRL